MLIKDLQMKWLYYFDQINIDYKNIVNLIDKLPLTITELGFVKRIFPDAKIITCS